MLDVLKLKTCFIRPVAALFFEKLQRKLGHLPYVCPSCHALLRNQQALSVYQTLVFCRLKQNCILCDCSQVLHLACRMLLLYILLANLVIKLDLTQTSFQFFSFFSLPSLLAVHVKCVIIECAAQSLHISHPFLIKLEFRCGEIETEQSVTDSPSLQSTSQSPRAQRTAFVSQLGKGQSRKKPSSFPLLDSEIASFILLVVWFRFFHRSVQTNWPKEMPPHSIVQSEAV